MAHNIRNVTKSRPCPICGKPDWCGFMPASDYGELIICHRDTDQSNKIGFDGNFYVFVGSSKSGNSVFEEANQRMAKDAARKGNKNYTFSSASSSQPRKLTIVDQVYPSSNLELDKIYRTMLSFLVLEQRHRDYLKHEGWSDELLAKYHIVSFPEKDFTRFKYRKSESKNPYRKALAKKVMESLNLDNLRGVPGAYKDNNGNWTFAGRSGILFPQPDPNHLIYRLRLRMDFRDVNAIIHSDQSEEWFLDSNVVRNYIDTKGVFQIHNGKKEYEKSTGKYRNFASYHIDEEEEVKGFLVNSYNQGCESGNQLGFYYTESRDDMFIAYVTEGEKKGIFCNDKMRAPFVSVPGVNSWSLLFQRKDGYRPIDVLKEKGVKIIVVAYDADKAVNAKVLQAEQQVVEELRKEGFILGAAEWDMSLGKGIDDLLFKGHKPNYVSI